MAHKRLGSRTTMDDANRVATIAGARPLTTTTVVGTGTHGLVSAFHTVSSLTPGHLLQALTADTFGFAALPNTAVTPGSFGSATQVPVYTVGADGRLTFAENITISGVVPSAHDIVSVHSASGLTAGHIMQALSGTTFGFGAFDWDTLAAAASADMVHDHTSATEGGTLTISAEPPPGYFGDGSDGDVVVSVAADLSDYVTLCHFDNLTINAGQVLTCNQDAFPIIFVAGTLTINGTIRNNGGDGLSGNPNTGTTGGGGGQGGEGGIINYYQILDGLQGSNGGAAGASGDAAQSYDFEDWEYMVSKTDSAQDGADGGNGITGAGGAGGAGFAFAKCRPANYVVASTLVTYRAFFMGDSLPGASAGGGGGVAVTGSGGGGAGGMGGQAGNISIIARNIVWGAAGLVEANGGDGGNGGASDGDGGGGGGGAGGNGGIVILCYMSETGSRHVHVAAGAGGTGGTSVSASAGANGPNGYDGVVIDLGA